MIEGSYVFKKEIDWSALHQGISIPLTFQVVVKDYINMNMPRGKTVKIKIIFDGKTYAANLVNQKFDEQKYPTHKDILQIRYNPQSELANKLRNVFKSSYIYLSKQRQTLGKSYMYIVAPDNLKEYLAIYTTNYPLTFLFESITCEEKNTLVAEIGRLREEEYEKIINLTDHTAGYYLTTSLNKVRRLNNAIGNALKTLYKNQCQICGYDFASKFGVSIVEAHHIIPFTVSLNNNPENIMILCPNHHVVIHKAKPVFDWQTLSFRFENGVQEPLRINMHLVKTG